jgi:hypothetical protein
MLVLGSVLIMATNDLQCDVVEGILRDLEEVIKTLERIKKKFEYFHYKDFGQ